MGMTTHVVGFHPADDTYRKMKAVWSACTAAGIRVPEEVSLLFDDRDPSDSPDGVMVNMEGLTGVKPYRGRSQDGFEIDLRLVPPNIRIIRFYNSY